MVGTGVESATLVLDRPVGREHDDPGTIRGVPQRDLLRDVEARQAGQPDVQHDDVVGVLVDQVERHPSVGGTVSGVALAGQSELDQISDVIFVLDNQYICHLQRLLG